MVVELRDYASNWRFMAEVEPKEMSESFITQPFNESEFNSIKEILTKNWPEGSKVVEKIVKVEVPVDVVREVNINKPNKLALANELIYGINREMNPSLGIEMYIEEADRNNNPDACNMVGYIY